MQIRLVIMGLDKIIGQFFSSKFIFRTLQCHIAVRWQHFLILLAKIYCNIAPVSTLFVPPDSTSPHQIQQAKQLTEFDACCVLQLKTSSLFLDRTGRDKYLWDGARWSASGWSFLIGDFPLRGFHKRTIANFVQRQNRLTVSRFMLSAN